MMKKFDLSHYLVIGPENCVFKSFEETLSGAVRAGFTCVQIRAKNAADSELFAMAERAAQIIAKHGKENSVTLLINDRADIAKTAREHGIKVDGVHVGQSDTPPRVCREMLGKDAVIGLSAPQEKLSEYLDTADLSCADYLGLAPLHETATKTDLKKDSRNNTIIPTLAEIDRFAKKSPLPVVVGGGVGKEDLPLLAKTAASGYFVVSAVCAAENPFEAAAALVREWNLSR